MSGANKLLLIGWDAADWRVIRPMLDRGLMPHLQGLIATGSSGNIATLQPMLSPMLWTSIATGKRPFKHGVLGFTEPDPVSGGIRPVTNLSRRTKAVWNILNQNELRSIMVGWWPSHPVEPLSHGVMVSNHYQRATTATRSDWKLEDGTVHPSRLAAALAELRFHPSEVTGDDLVGFLPEIVGMPADGLERLAKDPRVRRLIRILADMTSIHSAATALIQNEPWDFMAVYYDAIDHFGHLFMKYHPPRRDAVDDEDFRMFHRCLEAGYIFQDAMLGAILALAGADTTVILMSDHGFHPDEHRPLAIPREPAGPAVEHRQIGILVARGPNIREGATISGASLLDICPTILNHFGLPVGEDMDGKVLLEWCCEVRGLRRIPSWDRVDGDAGTHPPDCSIAPSESRAAIEQLVALGYIEPQGAQGEGALEVTVRELDYNLAVAYMDGGIFGEAAILLERLYEEWPMEHRFGLKLAATYEALGRIRELRPLVETLAERRIEEARAAVDKIRQSGWDDPEKREAEQRRIDGLRPAEQRRIQIERRNLLAAARPNLFALSRLEISCDLAEGAFTAARTKLDALDAQTGRPEWTRSLRVRLEIRRRNWDRADDLLNRLLEEEPESPSTHYQIARVALGRRDYQGAIASALESIRLLYQQPRAHYLLGVACLRCERLDQAEGALFEVIRQAPRARAAFRQLVEVSRRRGDREGMDRYRAFIAEINNLRRRERTAARESDPFPQAVRGERALPVLRPRPTVLEGIPESEIITVVTGLPRSGTSLMMQVLRAAGIESFTDGTREADASNPKGYYEHSKVTRLRQDRDKRWLLDARGKAIKVVAPLLPSLPVKVAGPDPSAAEAAGQDGAAGPKPQRLHYRVLFMDRPMGEILDSQQSMLSRVGKASSERSSAETGIAKAYRQQLYAARAAVVRTGMTALEVSFPDLIRDPEGGASRIAAFLGCPERAESMAAQVSKDLYRSTGGQCD